MIPGTIDYLREHGWNVRPLPPGEGEAARGELHARLRARIEGMPAHPMPQGKIAANLWNLFPEAARVPESRIPKDRFPGWRARLRAEREWIALPESTLRPAMVVESAAVSDDLPEVDLYLLPLAPSLSPSLWEAGDVLAFDHEGIGPWAIGADFRGRIPERRIALPPLRDPLPAGAGVALPEADASELRAWLVGALRGRGIEVPTGRFATEGPPRDCVWNHLDEEFDAALTPRFLRRLLSKTDTVAAWNEGEDAVRLRSPDPGLFGRHGDAYYLDWPGRRWLLAVPEPYVREGEESPVLPSFVPLDRRAR